MPAIREPKNLGDLLKYEAPNLYSRDRVTVAAGQTLSLGCVVGIVNDTGNIKAFDPSSTDGSQFAAGVLMQDVDAQLVDISDALIIARHAIVSDHALVFPAEIAAAEKAVAIQQLKNLGILVRQGA
jgi:hypothetical protein